jgi:cytidylate kinase
MKQIIIALDGPAGSGKTSSAKIVAEKLGYLYIDTGAMYRAVALAWLRLNKEYDEAAVADIMDSIELELKNSELGQRTILNGEDVSDLIRTPEVTKHASAVAAIPKVRIKLTEMQRKIGANGGVVMDGRDIGSAVFPNAELKIFLSAGIEARAERRALEMRQKGMQVDIEALKKEIADRDAFDSSREMNPLTKAADAIEIDTSHTTIESQCEMILNLAKKIIEA